MARFCHIDISMDQDKEAIKENHKMIPARLQGQLTRHYHRIAGSRNAKERTIALLLLMCIFVLYTLMHSQKYPYEFESEGRAEIESKERRNDIKSKSMQQLYCDIKNISQTYDADFKCVETKTSPSVHVCLYDSWNDMYISHDLEETGTWEPHVLKDVQETLRRNPNAGFIDVGANIGFYSLIAAKMGHKVVAVEPLDQSLFRLHKAAQTDNTFQKIVVVRNAVADYRIMATVVASGDNQGDTNIRMEAKPCSGSCLPTIKTILLDDLLEVANFSHAIMKIDIQGFEHRAFQHASLLLDHIHILYIFMEWITLKTFHVPSNQTSSDHYMVDEMLNLLFDRKYRPYALSKDRAKPLDPAQWDKWPNDIVWQKALDDDEQENVLRNHFINWPQ